MNYIFTPLVVDYDNTTQEEDVTEKAEDHHYTPTMYASITEKKYYSYWDWK